MLRIVVDANGYVSRILANYRLHLGTHDDIKLLWTDSLLHEVEKNLVKKSSNAHAAHRYVQVMCSYHPEAHVEVSRTDVDDLHNQTSGIDHGDIHILATAIVGNADILTIKALEQSLVQLDDYSSDPAEIAAAMSVAYTSAAQRIAENQVQAQQRLGTEHVVWVGAYTRKDGVFVPGYWRRA